MSLTFINIKGESVSITPPRMWGQKASLPD